MRSGARFATKAMVLNAAADDAAIKIAVRRIGPALVFERLWPNFEGFKKNIIVHQWLASHRVS